MAAMLLCGCKKSGGGATSFFSGSSESIAEEGSTGGGEMPHTPEPASIALLGSGLLAYALLRRRRKN